MSRGILLCRTRGYDWDYQFMHPGPKTRLNGFGDWFGLHGKMNYSGLDRTQEAMLGKRRFYYSAAEIETPCFDEIGRRIICYVALVSDVMADSELSVAEIENLSGRVCLAQQEINEMPYGDSVGSRFVSALGNAVPGISRTAAARNIGEVLGVAMIPVAALLKCTPIG